MYDHNRTRAAGPVGSAGTVGPADPAGPTYASTLSTLPRAGQPAMPGTLQPSHASASQQALSGRRPTPAYATMGGLENDFLAPQGALRKQLTLLGGLFQLPTSLQGYLVFTFCLLILAFTMVLHVTLSAEIMRLDTKLSVLQSDFEATEYRNAGLVYEIARYSSLQDVNRKAILAGYIPADAYKFVVERPEVVDALNNPAVRDLTPEYLILGGDPALPANPVVVLENAPAESADTGSFWSSFHWRDMRDALAETGSWLRSWLPARETP